MHSYLKSIFLAATPLLLALAVTYYFVTTESQRLSKQTLNTLESFLMESKKQELLNYTSIATSAVDHIYASSETNNEVAKNLVSNILENMLYDGDNGYFFAYDYKGTNIAHPKQPFRVGENWWELEDDQGNKLVQALIQNAKDGGGYYEYFWEKPSDGTIKHKLSYSWSLDKWEWMLGTGIYIDDLNAQVQVLQNKIDYQIQSNERIILTVAVLSIFLISILGLILSLTEKVQTDYKLHELSQRVTDLQEEERRRISRELHDGISQILVGIKYSLEASLMFLRKNDQKQPDELQNASNNLDDAIHEIRRISHDLHPRVLDELGLGSAIDSLSDEFSHRTGTKLEVSIPAVKKVIPPDITTSLYRVVQESLTNIERHANASFCQINLTLDRMGLTLIISDNGQGFNTKQKNQHYLQGIGLRNLRERIKYHNGEFFISSDSTGSIVTAKIPKSSYDSYNNQSDILDIS